MFEINAFANKSLQLINSTLKKYFDLPVSEQN